jgi:voltage-gated potassium channel
MKFLFFSQYGFQNLLICFFFYLLVGPFLDSFQYGPVFMKVFFTALLVFAVYAIHKKVKLLRGTVILLSFILILLWINEFNLVHFSTRVMNLLLCVYLALLVYSFLQYIFRTKRVDVNLISASLCLYLIIGLLWGTVYWLIEAYIPGSFGGDVLAASGSASESLHHFYYFSYITLTTVGYGDILPLTKGATSLCQTEAIIGQFFTAVLVARLVGIEVAQQFTGET